MKIKKKQIKIPTAKFGLEQIGNIAESLPEATTLLTSPFQKSTATSGGEATMQSIQGIANGVATGAKLGSFAGPMGAVAGAIGGAAVGLVGKKGDEAEMTSFTDYDEGTLGTGLIGAFTNKKLRKERKRVKMNAYNNRAAVQGTEYLANEYYTDYGDMDTNTFAVGGLVLPSLVYADDGELIKTPDGDINKIPEQGKPTDSNLLNLPEGSRILSNTLKVPGTKDTFAKVGEKIMKKKSKSKYTDKYAENSQMLNDMNNQIAYDNLFELQEQVKAKKGIKPKTKQLIPAAEYGEETGTKKPRGPFNGRRQFSVKGNYYTMVDPTKKVYKYDQPMGPPEQVEMVQPEYFTAGEGEWSDENTRQMLNDLTKKNLTNTKDFALFPSDPNLKRWGINEGWSKGLEGGLINPNEVSEQPQQASVKAYPSKTPSKKGANIGTKQVSTNTETNNNRTPYDWAEDTYYRYVLPYNNLELNTVDDSVPEIEDTASDINPENYINKNKFPWDKIINGLTGLAEISPALSNLFTGKPKNIDANYNPYANAILNAARGRRYNINPALRDIERNRAISNYNASQVNTNTGAGMAFRLANAVNTDKAISDIRAQESNINNQYLGEYANIANNLGQQWVGATNLAEDLNRKSYANARNIRRQGLSQLSQWLQNRRLMSNQTSRDNALLNLYAPFLEGIFTNEDIKNYAKWIKKGGNSWE